VRIAPLAIRAATLGLLASLLPPAAPLAAGSGGAYPVASRRPAPGQIARLVFSEVWIRPLPGLPAPGEPALDRDGTTLIVVTDRGVFALRAESGDLLPGGTIPEARAPQPSCNPHWAARLAGLHPDAAFLAGPSDTVAVIGRDGTISARTASRGHLLWRRLASNRVSRPAASLGGYILVVPDGARSLQAFRWPDGEPAGGFTLAGEDDLFASGPRAEGDFVYVLAVSPPRAETRVLCLRAGLGRPPSPASPKLSETK